MDSETLHILLVDDSETYAAKIHKALESGPRQVKLSIAQSLAEARTHLSESVPDLVIIDLLLPDGRGIELLPTDLEAVTFPVVIMTNCEDVQTAVETMKAGALDYVIKSAETLGNMPRTVERALREWARITERRRAEEALQSFFESAASGMAIISPEGKALKVNPTFCRLSGYSEAEALNKNVFEVTHPEDREETGRLYGDIRAGRCKVADFEKRYLCKNGDIVWGRATVAGVFGPNQELLYYAVNVQDITERKKADNKLKEVNRELDAFVYTVSHDLRTPLTPIICYADFLKENYKEHLDQQGLDCLAEITNAGEKMLALMEDLLFLAMVGHLERPANPVDTNEVLQTVLVSLAGQIAKVDADVQAGSLPTLQVPETLLTQILVNLIGNALRYGVTKGGNIEVGGERRENRVLLFVRDHGPGIPKEELGRLFDVFFRGETGIKLKGTGVGLATVQKIACLYGGRAWVEETPGGGSTFWVEMEDVPSSAEKEDDNLSRSRSSRMQSNTDFEAGTEEGSQQCYGGGCSIARAFKQERDIPPPAK